MRPSGEPRVSEHGGFDLEPDPPEPPEKAPAEQARPQETRPALAPGSVRRKAAEPPPGPRFLSRMDPIVLKRLRRMVPIFAIAYVGVGFLFVRTGLWAFALFGAAVGAFAAECARYRPCPWLRVDAVARRRSFPRGRLHTVFLRSLNRHGLSPTPFSGCAVSAASCIRDTPSDMPDRAHDPRPCRGARDQVRR